MKYRKITARKPGGPEVLELTYEEIPSPVKNLVLVKVLAAGVAYADVLMREGVYPGMPGFPLTPGYDILGIVEKIGENVRNVRTGDKVTSLTVTGGYAEYILIPEEECISVPPGMDDPETVSLVLNYVTAHQMLHREVSLRRGDSILVFGAAGGVGSALLQLGKIAGLKVYGTASKEKHALIEEFGGIPLDYKNDNVEHRMKEYEPNSIAAVFDGTGKWLYPACRLLRNNGRLIVFGASSMLERGRKNTENRIRTLLRFSIFLRNYLPGKKKILFYSITARKKKHPEWFREDLQTLFVLLGEKKIKPLIAMKKKLEEAQLCHELLNGSSIAGKLVILPCDK